MIHVVLERDALISNEVKRYKQEANSVREQKRQLEQQLREVQVRDSRVYLFLEKQECKVLAHDFLIPCTKKR